MKEMTFRGIPVKVYPAGVQFSYRPMQDRRHKLIEKRDGKLFIDVVPNAFGPYIAIDKVLATIVVEEPNEIPRNYDLEPVTIGAILTRGMVAVTREEADELLEGLSG